MRLTDNIRIEMLPVTSLFVDERYQRDLELSRVEKIVAEFDWNKFGVLEVSERDNGRHATFDGQHRREAVMLLGIEYVPSLVHENLTPQEEARLFTEIQTKRKGLGQIDRFRADVFAGREMSVAIKNVLDSEGFSVGRGSDPNTISAIVTLERMYRRYGEDHLRETLTMARDTWGTQDGALTGAFLDGLARWLAGYGDRLSDEVTSRLRDVSPQVIRRRASAIGGGGSQIGGLVAVQIQKVAKVRGRPRKTVGSIWSDRKGERF